VKLLPGENKMDNDEKEENVGINYKEKSHAGKEIEETLMEDTRSSELKAIQDQLEKKKREYDELYDKYLRVVADFDNYKKRVAKEKADIMSYGNEELIKELLHVLDNLERALGHAEISRETKLILEGINLVHKQFLSCLEKFGVKPISATKGDKFDPRYHQAIEYEQSSEIMPGLIISEVLKGYTMKDRLLRPSLVIVSKEIEVPSVHKKTSVKTENGYETENSGSDEMLDLIDENSDNN
jgi:molecular chaperone GrpE